MLIKVLPLLLIVLLPLVTLYRFFEGWAMTGKDVGT